MKTLLVGFKAYAAHKENPAEKVLAAFEGREGVKTVLLDVSFKKVLDLSRIIEEEKPDCIVTVNLSPFRKEPAIEEYAYNEMNSVQPDEDGEVMLGEEIVPGGPKSLNCALDIPSVQQFVASCGNAVSISIDPGRFVCNEASYLARLSGKPSLSIHIPLEKDYPLSEDIELVENFIDYFKAML